MIQFEKKKLLVHSKYLFVDESWSDGFFVIMRWYTFNEEIKSLFR